jgi:hypothetical protein
MYQINYRNNVAIKKQTVNKETSKLNNFIAQNLALEITKLICASYKLNFEMQNDGSYTLYAQDKSEVVAQIRIDSQYQSQVFPTLSIIFQTNLLSVIGDDELEILVNQLPIGEADQ